MLLMILGMTPLIMDRGLAVIFITKPVMILLLAQNIFVMPLQKLALQVAQLIFWVKHHAQKKQLL